MGYIPEWVGAGPVIYDSALTWPASLEITAASLPAGISTGDSLVLFVSASYGQKTFPLPIDDKLGSFGGVSAWIPIDPAQFTSVGGTSTGYWQLWAYVMQYDESAFPFALTPLKASDGTPYIPVRTGGNYRAQMAAWTPPLLYGDRDSGTAFNNATRIPNGTTSVNLTDEFGVVIAAAALPSSDTGLGGEIGAFFLANNFTEQHHEPPIQDHGGSLKIADYVPGGYGSVAGPQWVKPTGPSGIGLVFSLVHDTGGEDWGMNVVRW